MNNLPVQIQNYIEAANAGDAPRVAAGFIDDGVVRDEGGEHRGRAAIAAWSAETTARYGALIAPRGMEAHNGAAVLQASVSGNFPGSPALLTFHFALQSGGIASLEITA